jgi:DNA-binding NarL/FixJ family response regulator
MFYEKLGTERARLPTGDVLALSQRELEVLAEMARGLSNREIAARLYIAESTVAHHVSAIYAKLGVVTRAQAIIYAIRAGLVDPHRPADRQPPDE